MKEFFGRIEKEVGHESLELALLKQYVKTEEDISHFNKIAIPLCDLPDYGRQPLINAIVYYIEDKVLQDQTLDGWQQLYNAAFESKQGLLDLIREDGIDSYDTYQFVDKCFTDQMVQHFGQAFSGDLDSLDYELVQYYNKLYPDAC
ncbi:hypothetical protein [Paenibacillus sp. MSJ-34]|uniref:hypothetical protein n=1 Tax=Paenibacillus sp. MSJ-34 TaxID=2841529 RepID=UPI001C122821|nr:hypothetical protein [Paenibacillus sp. MSJ-34]MBU5444194.1 hypothetical protein [Paenibacillus sp. MSJ-34]